MSHSSDSSASSGCGGNAVVVAVAATAAIIHEPENNPSSVTDDGAENVDGGNTANSIKVLNNNNNNVDADNRATEDVDEGTGTSKQNVNERAFDKNNDGVKDDSDDDDDDETTSDQKEKEHRTLFYQKMNKYFEGYKRVTMLSKEEMDRIIQLILDPDKFVGRKTAKEYKMIRDYAVVHYLDGSAKLALKKDVSKATTASNGEVDISVLPRAVYFEELFDCIRDVHLNKGHHSAFRNTHQMVQLQYSNISRTMCDYFVHLCSCGRPNKTSSTSSKSGDDGVLPSAAAAAAARRGTKRVGKALGLVDQLAEHLKSIMKDDIISAPTLRTLKLFVSKTKECNTLLSLEKFLQVATATTSSSMMAASATYPSSITKKVTLTESSSSSIHKRAFVTTQLDEPQAPPADGTTTTTITSSAPTKGVEWLSVKVPGGAASNAPKRGMVTLLNLKASKKMKKLHNNQAVNKT